MFSRYGVVMALSLSVACGEKAGDFSETQSEFDEMASELWAEIDGLDSWSQYEGWEGIVASSSVHGDFVQIWLNDAALTAITAGEEIPDGAILLKETYNDAEGTELKDITVMKKVDGYNPDGSDWYWAQYLEDGTVQTAGSPDMCTGCHSSGEDYIRFTSE